MSSASAQELARLSRLLSQPTLDALVIRVGATGEVLLKAVGQGPMDVVQVSLEGGSIVNLLAYAPFDWWKNSKSLVQSVTSGLVTIPTQQSLPEPPPPIQEPLETPTFILTLKGLDDADRAAPETARLFYNRNRREVLLSTSGTEYQPLGSGTSVLVVDTLADRDALVTPDVGLWVRVLSSPYVYEKTPNGWRKVLTVGQANLADILTTDLSGVKLYCSATGNDDTGDGSLQNPWRQPQRALDAIPDGALGFVQINLIGVGPYKAWKMRQLPSSYFLDIFIVGDTQASPDQAWTLPAGVLPTNGGGGTKQGVYEYNVGSYSTVLSEGSHWIHFQVQVGGAAPGVEIPYGFIVDGAKSVSPKVRSVTQFDLGSNFSATANLRPVITEITGVDDNVPVLVTIMNENTIDDDGFGINVTGIGLRFTGSTVATSRTNYSACVADNSSIGFNNCHNLGLDFAYTNSSSSDLADGNNTHFTGLWGNDTTVTISGIVRETFMSGVVRGRDGSAVSAYIGGVTGGRAPTPCAVEVEFLDLEHDLVAGANGFHIQGAHVRFGNHFPVSVENVTQFFHADSGAVVLVVRVNGSVHGTKCCEFTDGATGQNFAGLAGTLTNNLHAGQEVTVGSDPTFYAFSALPKTDLSQGNASHLCRCS